MAEQGNDADEMPDVARETGPEATRLVVAVLTARLCVMEQTGMSVAYGRHTLAFGFKSRFMGATSNTVPSTWSYETEIVIVGDQVCARSS